MPRLRRPSRMADRISFIAVGLDGDPLLVEHRPVNMKLFSKSDNEERDAEFYLNIDTRNSSVQFHEKDTDYRRGVVFGSLRQHKLRLVNGDCGE